MAKQPDETKFPAQPVNGKHRRGPYRSALTLQHLLLDAAERKETTPSALAQLARAWSELEERKRIIRMRPAPKPIDVSPKLKRGGPTGWSGPIEAPAAEVKAAEAKAPDSPLTPAQ